MEQFEVNLFRNVQMEHFVCNSLLVSRQRIRIGKTVDFDQVAVVLSFMLFLIFFSIELEDLLPSDSKEYGNFDDMKNLLETPNLNSYLPTTESS